MKLITKLFGLVMVAAFIGLVATPSLFAQIVYINTIDGSSNSNDCVERDIGCTLSGATTRIAGASEIAFRVRRIGDTVTIPAAGNATINLNTAVTLSLYLRGQGADDRVRGTIEFDEDVTLGSSAEISIHKDATVEFSEVILQNGVTTNPFDMDEGEGSRTISTISLPREAEVSFEQLNITSDLTVRGPASGGATLTVNQLTVGADNTLTIGPRGRLLDLVVSLSASDDEDSKADEVTVDGDIEGDGGVWITALRTPPLSFREPHQYNPDEDGVNHIDCLIIKGSGTIANNVNVVGAGNVCIELDTIGGLDVVATPSVLGAADVFFTGDVMVTRNVIQRENTRVLFEGTATIGRSVHLLSDPPSSLPEIDSYSRTGTDFRTGDINDGWTCDYTSQDPIHSRGENIPGVQFAGVATITGGIELDSAVPPSNDITMCGSQVLFMGPVAEDGKDFELTSTVTGDIDFKNGGHIHLHGHSMNFGDPPAPHTSFHNLSVGGDIYSEATDGDGDPLVGSITMGEAAVSTIDGKCASGLSLGSGNRLTLTGEDKVISTTGTLEIPTLVAMNGLQVQVGTLDVETLHIGGGELEAGDNLGTVEVKNLILQGDGVDGSIDASELITIAYGTHSGDEIDLPATLTTLVLDFSDETKELRITEELTVENLGLCGGNLTLVEVDEDPEKNRTLEVTEFLHVRDGNLVFDEDDPGSIVTDMADPADLDNDGYILRYETAGARTVAEEWFAPRKVVVDHADARITVGEAKEIPTILHLFKGEMHLEDNLEVNGQLLVDEGTQLLAMGNNVITRGAAVDSVRGTLMTDGGNLHVLGRNNSDGVYQTNTAQIVVSPTGVVDVGTGTLQLGPNELVSQDNLMGDARPEVTLIVNDERKDDNGMVAGRIEVPMGSKRTNMFGSKFDVVVYDGTATPNTGTNTGNWSGSLIFQYRSHVVIDSLEANNGGVDFRGYNALEITETDDGIDDDSVVINKSVALTSAQINVFDQVESITFGENFSISGTGGFASRDLAMVVTVEGDFTFETDKDGAVNSVFPESGVSLSQTTTKTVEGDFRVFGDGAATRYGTASDNDNTTKLVLHGGFDFSLSGEDYVLNADLEFAGKSGEPQSITTSEINLGNVEIDNGAGVLLKSHVMQHDAATLTLIRGVIHTGSDSDFAWLIKNPTIEENLIRRNAGSAGAGVIVRGSRQSYVSGALTRHLEFGNAGGGNVSGGYLFPLGTSDEDASYYRPVVVQLPADLVEQQPLTVAPMIADGTPNWPDDGLVVRGSNASLTLDVYSDIFWRANLGEEQILTSEINLRVAAAGLSNVFDASRLRIVQWDCDWTNPRLAGQYDITGSASSESFAVNDYVNGSLNITQEGIIFENCAIFGIAANGIENPIHLSGGSGLAEIQFIHNAAVPVPVSIGLGAEIRLTDLSPQNATGYLPLSSGSHVAMITASGVPEAQLPDPISLPNLESGKSYVAIIHGAFPAENIRVKFFESRKVSAVTNMVEAALVHGVFGAPAVTVFELDPINDAEPPRLITRELAFDNHTRYLAFEPGFTNLQVATLDNDQVNEIAVFQVDLGGRQGEAVILNFSGAGTSGGLEVYGVDVNGDEVPSYIIRRTDVDTAEEIPTEFALHGNYPNPFNPSTQITFDLPESAQVSLQVIDMLGREVMTLPAREFDAGANRSIELNAINLSSGAYLYRMIATGAESQYVKTGRMTLVK